MTTIPGNLPVFPVNRRGRDFAVGDIHGCFTVLRCALNLIGFNSNVDRLFAVGDLVDRGPDSADVLEWLDQDWFVSVMGNHDAVASQIALGDDVSMDAAMMGGGWLDQESEDSRLGIGKRLARLPLALEVETPKGRVGIVHADCPFDDWREMRDLDWSSVSPNHGVGAHCIWSIDRANYGYKLPVRNIHAVVHGHLTIPQPMVLGNVHYIDTGGWRRGGYFTFLRLDTLKPIAARLRRSLS